MIVVAYYLYCDHESCSERFEFVAPGPAQVYRAAAASGWSHRLQLVDGFGLPRDYCAAHASEHVDGTIALWAP